MKILISVSLWLFPSILPYSSVSADPNHNDSFSLTQELDNAPKEIRSPPLTHGSTSKNKFANFEPVEKDGRTIGYKITPTELGMPLFSKYGLVSGDVVTMINGISIVNQKNATRALRKLVKAPSIDLEILRNKIKVKLSISLE